MAKAKDTATVATQATKRGRKVQAQPTQPVVKPAGRPAGVKNSTPAEREAKRAAKLAKQSAILGRGRRPVTASVALGKTTVTARPARVAGLFANELYVQGQLPNAVKRDGNATFTGEDGITYRLAGYVLEPAA